VAEFLDDYVFPNRYSSFPLVEDGRPVGLATLNRIKDVPAEERSHTPVRDIACTDEDLVRLSPEDTLSDALQQLQGCADGRAVVVQGDRVVGILSPSDISRQAQISALRASADDRFGGHDIQRQG
jgi:CBS domain-containing protein